MYNRVVLISGSPEIDIQFLKRVVDHISLKKTPIYAIDKGLEICALLNLNPTKIIGDLDSIDKALLKNYPPSIIYQFNPEKDQSDTEIGIELAQQNHFDDIILINASGGRPDHYLFNILLLFKAPEKCRIITKHGIMWGYKITQPQKIKLSLPNESLFSLIPWSICTNVSLEGAKYPLNHQTLSHSSLTLSNIAKGPVIISIDKGNLIFFSEAWKYLVSHNEII